MSSALATLWEGTNSGGIRYAIVQAMGSGDWPGTCEIMVNCFPEEVSGELEEEMEATLQSVAARRGSPAGGYTSPANTNLPETLERIAGSRVHHSDLMEDHLMGFTGNRRMAAMLREYIEKRRPDIISWFSFWAELSPSDRLSRMKAKNNIVPR